MQNNSLNVPGSYESRWFIWTIVFLVVTGVSLVSYILLSDAGTNDASPIVTAHAKSKNQAAKMPITDSASSKPAAQ